MTVSSGVRGRVVYQLKRAEQAIRTAIDDALMPLGITSAQYGALAALEALPGATSAELARACLVTAQSMHELIAVLAGRGLVVRARRDGRSLHLDVSAAGRKILRAAHKLVDQVERDVLGPRQDRRRLQADLTALVSRLTSDAA
jgi:DNA-binding MarR family transcriptional regulator